MCRHGMNMSTGDGWVDRRWVCRLNIDVPTGNRYGNRRWIGDEFADWKWMGLQEKGVLT